MSSLQSLRERLAELADLSSLGRVASWDQRTMMPPGGATARAQALAALERLAHARATSDDVGAWLDAVDADGDLGDLDRDVVRLARRDWERKRRVPAELAAARVQASGEGQAIWDVARAGSDFALFAPALLRDARILAHPVTARYPAGDDGQYVTGPVAGSPWKETARVLRERTAGRPTVVVTDGAVVETLQELLHWDPRIRFMGLNEPMSPQARFVLTDELPFRDTIAPLFMRLGRSHAIFVYHRPRGGATVRIYERG